MKRLAKDWLFGCSVFLFLTAIGLVATTTSGVRYSDAGKPLNAPKNALQCPSPAVWLDGRCVLTQNEVLDKTIDLSSGMVLDCQGHKLTPALRGKEPTGTNASVPSVPVAAIFLNDATGVHVRNCVIEDFDFGIVIIRDEEAEQLSPRQRLAQRNIISASVIDTLYNGINIIQADNIEITGNRITSRAAAAGIQILLDSDSLHIHHNQITTTKPSWREQSVGNPFQTPYYPGSPDIFNFSDGISFTQMPNEVGNEFTLGDTHITFVMRPSARATNNIVEDNAIDLTQSKGTAGVYAAVFQEGLIIRRNQMMDGSYGVALTPFLYTNYFPDPSTWPANVLIVENVITNPYTAAVALRNAFDTVVRHNLIRSTVGESVAGVLLLGKSLETATVMRNTIQGTKFGLRLRAGGATFFGPHATFFGAKVFLNDITATSKALDIPDDSYSFPSDFSFQGQGNYWGRTCDDSEGFREPGDPNPDSPNTLVVDSHPYGASVAGTSAENLPQTCK